MRRNSEINEFFTQALLGFVLASKSKNIIGVNVVQPESGFITIRDFKEQMHIFNYLHKQYPKVHRSIHAGELTNNITQKTNLRHHIKDAIFIGKAERIGHGVDVMQENNSEHLLSYMSSHHIPVEINLTSNKLILSVFGKAHPILDYINHEVPVVLSTDDEGILQTNLTKEYVTAAINYNLNYLTLKNTNRNTLTYSFLPGKSIWENPAKQILIKECQDIFSTSCKKICALSPKAQLQVKLEKQLAKFEELY